MTNPSPIGGANSNRTDPNNNAQQADPLRNRARPDPARPEVAPGGNQQGLSRIFSDALSILQGIPPQPSDAPPEFQYERAIYGLAEAPSRFTVGVEPEAAPSVREAISYTDETSVTTHRPTSSGADVNVVRIAAHADGSLEFIADTPIHLLSLEDVTAMVRSVRTDDAQNAGTDGSGPPPTRAEQMRLELTDRVQAQRYQTISLREAMQTELDGLLADDNVAREVNDPERGGPAREFCRQVLANHQAGRNQAPGARPENARAPGNVMMNDMGLSRNAVDAILAQVSLEMSAAEVESYDRQLDRLRNR